MIAVNLLPEEYRRRERTPIRIFAATLAAAVVVTSLGGTVAFFRFGKLVTEQETLARLEEDRNSMEPQLKHHAALKAEIGENEKWHQTIRELRNNRITWTTKVDQFIDLISSKGDQGQFMSWFDDVTVNQTIDGKADGGTVSFSGHVQGDSVGLVADLIAAVKESPFYAGFSNSSAPEGRTVESAGGTIVDFPLVMTLAPRDPKRVAGKPATPEATPEAPSGAQTAPPAAK